jgi:hypothetical protein
MLFDYILWLNERNFSPNLKNLEYFLVQNNRIVNKSLEQGFSEEIIQVEG